MKREMASKSRNYEAPSRFIRASEVGRYAYCARSWWLTAVQGLPTEPTRLAAGVVEHAHHGRRVRLGVWQWRIGLALLTLALILAIILLRSA